MSAEVVEIDTLSSVFSLKVEYDKLANEKTEMQRHYVMVSLRYNGGAIMVLNCKACWRSGQGGAT